MEDSTETPFACLIVKSLKQHLGHLKHVWKSVREESHMAPAEGDQLKKKGPISLAALGLPPIAGGSKDAPSTSATVPHWSSTRAALPAPAPPGFHPATDTSVLHNTKTLIQSFTCHFHTPSFSCLPSAAALAFLQASFSDLFLFSLHFSLFLTPSPSVSLSLFTLHLSYLHLLPFTLPSPALGSPQPSFLQQGQEPLESP